MLLQQHNMGYSFTYCCRDTLLYDVENLCCVENQVLAQYYTELNTRNLQYPFDQFTAALSLVINVVKILILILSTFLVNVKTIYCNVTLIGNCTENVQKHFLHDNSNRKF